MAERQARNNSADASGSGQSEEASTNQEDIVLLESMGFQRERIIEALQMNGNDVNRAIAFLLG
jgi:NACalpha-BTF3-like transcription factor